MDTELCAVATRRVVVGVECIRFLRQVFAILLLILCKLLNAVGLTPYLFLKAERDTAGNSAFNGWFDFKFNGRRWRHLIDTIQITPAPQMRSPSRHRPGRAFNSLAVALPQRFIDINRSYKVNYRPMQIHKNYGTYVPAMIIAYCSNSAACFARFKFQATKWPSSGLPTAIHTFRNLRFRFLRHNSQYWLILGAIGDAHSLSHRDIEVMMLRYNRRNIMSSKNNTQHVDIRYVFVKTQHP
jgi:hypothetical protein